MFHTHLGMLFAFFGTGMARNGTNLANVTAMGASKTHDFSG